MPLLSKIQPSFAGGELAPSLYARVDLAKYLTGLKRARNIFIHAHGGASNRPGTRFVGRVKDGSQPVRLIPFQFSTQDTYILEFGHQYMRVVRNGAHVVEAAKTITAATQANPVQITSAGHGFANGDEVYISGVGGMTQLNGRNFKVAGSAANTFTLQDLDGNAVDGSAYTAFTAGGSVARVYTLATPYAATDLARLKFAQSADVMYLVHPGYAVRKLSRTGHAAWTLAAVTFAPSISAPAGVGVSASGTGSTTYKYKVTAVKAETMEESLPSAEVSCTNALGTGSNSNTVSWTTDAAATKYNVYKEKNGLFGWIGATESGSFTDDNIDPDLSDTPPKARNPFNAAGDYPGAVNFFEQRLTFAASTNKPQTFWMSQSSNFENFGVSSPAKDDDAVTFGIASRQVHEIRHLVELNDLIALTSGGEWKITAGGQSDVITPSSIRVRLQGERGASHVPPIVVGETVLYVQDKGAIVRDLGYKLEVDGYTGNDLSVLSNHLFQGYTIKEWAYAQAPHSLVWVVRSDGKALSLTYMREHEVWAWTWHETDGQFESVASVSEGNEDAVYFVVARTVGGQTKRYVERLASRTFADVTEAYFVDCGLSYSGPATKTLGGLHHLEGRTLVGLADGNVVRNLAVTSGAITLPVAAAKVHAGLAYSADLQTLSLEVPVQGGTVQGRQKNIGPLSLRVEKTRGLWVGPDEDHLYEPPSRSTEVWGAPAALHTGDMLNIPVEPSWTSEGSMYIRQKDPLPMTILAVIPNVALGG